MGSDEAGKGGERMERDHEIIGLSAKVIPTNTMKELSIFARDHSICHNPHASIYEFYIGHLILILSNIHYTV